MWLLNRRKYLLRRPAPQGAPLDIADAVITVASSVLYTGTPRTPVVEVVYDGETLVANVDYFVAYNDNTNLGAATAVVTGTGSFTGSVIKTFYIVAEPGSWVFDITKTADDPIASYEIDTVGSASGLRLHAFSGGLIAMPCPTRKVTRYELPGLSSSSSAEASNMNGGGISMSGTHFVYMNNGSLWHAEASVQNDVSSLYFSSVKMGVTNSASRKIVISGDGLHIYFIGMYDYGNGGKIFRHDLSSAFDFSTVSSDHDATVLFGYATSGKYQDFCFAPNGRRMLWYDDATAYVFALSTAWDVETATLVGSKTFQSSIACPAVAVNANGTRLYLANGSGSTVQEFALSA